MIVDDSPVMRTLMRSIVSKIAGAEVCAVCENGAQALQQLASARPDLVVTDIEMPVMDGLTFLKMARARTQVPIVVLSSVANVGNANVDKARALGASAVLAKPSGSISYDLEEKMGASIQRLIANLARATR